MTGRVPWRSVTRTAVWERNVERSRWTKAARPILSLAVLGAVLGGCAGDLGPSRYYGGGGGGYYGGPGYYGSPYDGGYGRYRGNDRFYGSRRHYGGGGFAERPSVPRAESPSRDPLRGFWQGQTTPPRDPMQNFWTGQPRPAR